MTLVLDDAAVQTALQPASLVKAIEAAIIAEPDGPSVIPERMNMAAAGRFLRVMPAIVPNSDVMGLKTFFGGGGAGVRYVVLLMSIDTGEVLAVMDACYLTAARTAATSAIGSSAMGADVSSIGILGSGLEAEAHARTFAALGGVERITVFSPNPDNRRRFAERLGDELAVDVVAAESAEAAAADVRHLITATNTGYGGPIACRSEWLGSDLHLTAIGSTHYDLRELETDILHRATAIVVDAEPDQIAVESGDVSAFVAEGGSLGGFLRLDELLQGSATLPSGDDLVIFKSVGTALQDMVAADLAYRYALDHGIGTELPELATPKVRR